MSLTFSPNGWTTQWATIVETNSGGVYGWWGTAVHYGARINRCLAFARPDSIGIVDYKTGAITKTLDIVPLADLWRLGLGARHRLGAGWQSAVHHRSHGRPWAQCAEESTRFRPGSAHLPGAVRSVGLIPQTGMFAYPLVSPLQETDSGDVDYQIAYLQALIPGQSETSRYRLMVMDRDGSNRRTLFPRRDNPGLEPQQLGAPGRRTAARQRRVGYRSDCMQGNLWLVDVQTGEAIQITGGWLDHADWQ